MGLSTIAAVENRPEMLTHFLDRLLPSIKIGEDELILVSDACRDARVLKCLKQVARSTESVKVIFLNEKVGYGPACNIAAQKAGTETLVFINTDVFPDFGAVQILADEVQTDLNVGAAQGLLIYPQTNRVQSTGHIFHDYLNFHALEGRKVDDYLVQERQERQALTSAFYAIRRETFQQFGGFDEFFFNAWEGMELSLRLKDSGMRCIYTPAARAFHVRGGGRRHFLLDETQQSAYFWAKWGNRIQNDLVALLERQLTPELKSPNYFAVNCGSTSTWRQTLEQLGLKVQSEIEVPDRFEEQVCLYDNLAHTVLTHATPLLFFSDHFEQLVRNRAWFRARQASRDLVIDLRGNVMLGVDLA